MTTDVKTCSIYMCLVLVYKLGWLQVSSKSFALYFLKGTHLGICRNGIFCTWARLFVFLASYLGTYCDSSHIYSRSYQIANVRSTINGKKLMQICIDIDWAVDCKNKMWCLSIRNFFHFHHSNLTSLFGVFKIKSLCNVKFTVDLMPFFAFFVSIFMSAHGDFSTV